MTGQEPQPGQTVWGAPISPDALPIGRTMAQYNAALDRSSEQQAYGADNGAVTYSSNPDGRPMIADDYVPGSDRPPISGESGAVGRGSLAPAGPAAPGSTALGVGAASNLSVPHNARRLADLDWSLGPIGVLQTQSFPVQPAPGPAGSRATEAVSPQKSVGVFTLLTANPRLKNDPLVTSDRYDSHGALVRDFVDAKTGEVIGSASPYNGAGLQPLSDGLTFVRYDSGATSARAPGVTNAEFIAADLYNRAANDWWDAWKRNGQKPFSVGEGFNNLSHMRAYNMLNAISSILGNQYVDSGMSNLNSIAMIGGLLPTDNWSASLMRYAAMAPEESAGIGSRFSGGAGYEPPGPSGLNRYGGLFYNPFAAEAPPVGPSGNHYSVAYHMELAPASYPGLSRAAHIQEANGSLLSDMESDPEFAQRMMEGLGINIERTPNGLAPRTSPEGWTWHHDQDPGAMQLVPRDQHAPGSIFQNALHPNGKGGYSIWGR